MHKKIIGITLAICLMAGTAFAFGNNNNNDHSHHNNYGDTYNSGDTINKGGTGVGVGIGIGKGGNVKNSGNSHNTNMNTNLNHNSNFNSNKNTNIMGQDQDQAQAQKQGQDQDQSQKQKMNQSQDASNKQAQSVDNTDTVTIQGNTNDITIEDSREFLTEHHAAGPDVRPFADKGWDASMDKGDSLVMLMPRLNSGQASNMTVNAKVKCTIDYITDLGTTTDVVDIAYNEFYKEDGVIALATCIATDNDTTMAGVYGTIVSEGMKAGAEHVMITEDNYEEVGFAKGYTLGFNTSGGSMADHGNKAITGGGGPGFTSNWGGSVLRPFMKAVFFVKR